GRGGAVPAGTSRRFVGHPDGQVTGLVADEAGSPHGPRLHTLHSPGAAGDRVLRAHGVWGAHLVRGLGLGHGRARDLLDPPARGWYWTIARAPATDLPRIWSRTRRALRADTRTKRARATVCMA